MKTKLKQQLEELERTVDEELKDADIYRHPIIKDHIEPIKDYFAKRKDIEMRTESGYLTFVDLTKKYYAIFSKVNGDK